MSSIIQTVKLDKTYSSFEVETTVLNKVSLRIDQGEFVAIMGPSGCGKSTLLNQLGLLDTPSGGEIYFLDEQVSHASSKRRALLRRKHIGFVFQSFNLIDELSIYENIELPLLYQSFSPQERRRRVDAVMEELHIAHKRNYFPRQISGGQQQAVAVARAIITRPQLILADEPTGNLDSARGQEVMELLTKLNDTGTTIVMVTHSSSAADYASRVVHLFDGQIVTENISNRRIPE